MIEEFDTKLNLRVCQIAEGNSGTTNVGPLVKEAFKSPETLAEIVNCPLNLIKGLKTIFEILDCGFLVDAFEFRVRTQNWLDEFHKSDWSWNQLNPTLHFIMYHGYEVNTIYIVFLIE